jgi:hypothetical protein
VNKPKVIYQCLVCSKRCTDREAEDRMFNTGRCFCGGELAGAYIELDGVSYYPLVPVPMPKPPLLDDIMLDIHVTHTDSAVLDAIKRGGQAIVAMVEDALHWTCVVCSTKHPIDHEGMFCGRCKRLACCGCEREMASHVCIEEKW